MSKLVQCLDRFLNATHVPIPISCAEGEENRKGETESEGRVEGGVEYTNTLQ